MAFALASAAQVAGLAPGVVVTRGRGATRRSEAVAAHGDVSRGRSISLSPAPGARSRSRGVGAGSSSGRGVGMSVAAEKNGARANRGAALRVRAESGVYDPAESNVQGFSASMATPTSMAKIGRQLGGGGSATLEKVGMNLSSAQQQSTQPKLADGGGNGGAGGGVKNGGGGGDGDEDDDDDYFEEGDDEDGDQNFLTTRQPMEERYDRSAVNAVLEEWFKTLGDVPAAIRMAIEMGIVSSSQLVRFMSVDVRPSMVRAVSRCTPWASRAFVGRLMADPAFLWKMAFEQTVTIGGAVMYEAAHRGDNLKAEWDLAAANVLQLSLANAMTVWCLTPSRSFGVAHKFGWQRAMDAIPNNAFDKCGPLRQYSMGMRGASFVAKAAELSALGAITGGVFHFATTALVGMHKSRDGEDFEPSIPVPDLKTSMLGMGAYLGLSCNLRYQLIGGADRWMTERLTSLASAITATGIGRLANNHVGDQTRLFALGLPMHATAIRSSRAAAPVKKKTKVVKKKRKVKKQTQEAALA